MDTLKEKLIEVSRSLSNALTMLGITYLVALASSWVSFFVYYKIPWPALILLVLTPISLAFPIVFPTIFAYRYFIEKNNGKVIKVILLISVFVISLLAVGHFQKLRSFHKEFSAYDRFKMSRDIETTNQLR